MNGCRLAGAAICACSFLAGIRATWFGLGVLRHAFIDSPSRDVRYFLFFGAVVCAIGLLVAVFSVRWLIIAIRAMRRAATGD